MAGLSDLEVIVFGSSRARKALFWLFLLSLVADAEMLLPPAALQSTAMLPEPWAHCAHVLAIAIGIVAFVSAAVLWLIMFYSCMRDPERPLALRFVWGLAFFFTIWLGAQFFYLFPFRRLTDRRNHLR